MTQDRSQQSSQHPSPLIKVVRASLLASLAAASVAACGGGGGGGGSLPPPPILPPPPPPPPPPPLVPPLPPPVAPPASFETPEYFGKFQSGNRSALAQIHASSAYSLGGTGQGVTVAVIDTNVDTTISELSGQIAGAFDVFASTRQASDIDTNGHGTMVTSVIVARKDDTGMHGVAYDAKVLSIRADTTGSCATPAMGDDEGGCRFNDSSLISAINYAVNNGAKIINMSLGGDDGDPISNALRSAIINAVNRGVLFTIAAGNEGAAPTGTDPAKGLNPTEPAIVASDPAVLGRVVAVGAIDNVDRTMPTFSNRAGSAANFYLLAPGQRVVTAGVDDNVRRPNDPTCSATVTTNCNDVDTDGDYWLVSGTSFSAPTVAGALAVLLDLFPNISPENALAILLTTADDYVTTTADAITGTVAASGTDPVGGRGIVNLQRALSPIGTVSLDFGQREVELGAVMGPASGALGDWVEASGAFTGLVFQDSFRRGFRLGGIQLAKARAPFSDFTLRADYARGMARALELGPASLSWFNAPKPAYDPRIPWMEAPDPTFSVGYSFAGGKVSAGRGGGPERLTPGMMLVHDPSGPATLGSGDSWINVAHAFGPAELDFRSSNGGGRLASGVGIGKSGKDWAVRLGYAAIKDDVTALGGTLQSRFGGDDRTRLSAVSLEGQKLAGSWLFSSAIEAGSARMDDLGVSGLWTSSWSLSAEHPFAGGALRFTAAQPRRAEGGDLAFDAPIELTKTGVLLYERRVAGLTPSGRELDLETAWTTRLGDMTTLEAAAALSIEPNHVRDADPAAAMWVSLRHLW